jgi:2-oxoglutarate ferredoxin oxidoreductase subunit gamma
MLKKRLITTDTVEIRLSGTGGQGLVLGGLILSEALIHEGKKVAQSQSYEPVSRGGMSRSDLVVSNQEVDFPLITGLDILVVLDQTAVAASDGLVREDGLVLVDADRVPSPPTGNFTRFSLPLSARAYALGNGRVTNMLALGAVAALSGICRQESLETAIQAQTPQRFVAINTEAMREGYRMALAALQAKPSLLSAQQTDEV